MPSDPSLVLGRPTKISLAATAIPLAGLALATVPTGAVWQCKTFTVRIVATAGAGTRRWNLFAPTVAAPYWLSKSLVDQTAGLTFLFASDDGIGATNQVLTNITTAQLSKDLHDLIMNPGDSIFIKDGNAIDAADTAAFNMMVYQRLAIAQ